VIDSHDENRLENVQQVDAVLEQIHADKIPCIHIMNKVDRSLGEPGFDIDSHGTIKRLWLSAQTGDGVDLLVESLAKYFREGMICGYLALRPDQARIRALLFEIGAVLSEEVDNDGTTQLEIRISRKDLNQLSSKEMLSLDIKAKK